MLSRVVFLIFLGLLIGTGPAMFTDTHKHALAGCSEWRQPTNADFKAVVGKDKAVFIDRVLSVIENEVVPKTQEGVRKGNKLFGAAILNKPDLSTILAVTNTETNNPSDAR